MRHNLSLWTKRAEWNQNVDSIDMGWKSRQEPCDVPCTPGDCCSGPVLSESGGAVLDIRHALQKFLV